MSDFILTSKQALILFLNYLFISAPKEIRFLMDQFQDIDDFKNNFHKFSDRAVLSKHMADLKKRLQQFNLDLYLENLAKLNINFVFIDQENYPAGFRDLTDAPAVIFYLGNIELVKEKPIIAIIGSRNCTEYGIDVTRYFTKELAGTFTICSGLAKGLDAISHQTAIKVNGKTIAIVGNSLDLIYPKENTALFKEMAKNHLIISEYPIQARIETYFFRQRNRLISAISQGVLVTEAQEKSGTLITAKYALDLGRDVFAVPSSIFNANNVGNHQLIQDGAKLVYAVDDILKELKISAPVFSGKTITSCPTVKNYEEIIKHNQDLTEIEQKILKVLFDKQGLSLDELTLVLNEPISSLLESITQLELADLIVEDKNQKYLVQL